MEITTRLRDVRMQNKPYERYQSARRCYAGRADADISDAQLHALRNLLTPGLVELRMAGGSSQAIAEDTSLAVLMMKLGAEDVLAPTESEVKLGSPQHSKRRRGEVDPQWHPRVSLYSRCEGPGRIHAHSGQGRLKADV